MIDCDYGKEEFCANCIDKITLAVRVTREIIGAPFKLVTELPESYKPE